MANATKIARPGRLLSQAFAVCAPLVLALLTSCDPAKRVAQGDHLLVRSRIELLSSPQDPLGRERPEREDLQEILKQQPNKKILFSRFYLGAYNLPDPQRMERREPIRQAAQALRNQRRTSNGKEPKPYVRSAWEWLQEEVGEPPVLLDSALTVRSADQLRLYMLKEGWFNAEVLVDSTLDLRRRRASVEYRISPGLPYRFGRIAFEGATPAIDALLATAAEQSLLSSGARFDSDLLDEERRRISAHLKDHGYLYYTHDLILFDADSTVGGRRVDVVMRTTLPTARPGETMPREGRVYQVAHVVVDTRGAASGKNIFITDTVRDQEHILLHTGPRPTYRTHALLASIFLRPGGTFRQSDADLTYKRLTGLRVFDRVEMTYDTTGTGAPDKVNAMVRLWPGKRQSVGAEGFGTNRGGFLGTSVNFNYRHRNLFRNMGALQLQMTVGLEAQQSFSGQAGTPTTEAGTTIGTDVLFNTVELGPELNVRLPRVLLVPAWFKRSTNARTAINVLYNYQRRPDYTRTVAKAGVGLEWNESPQKVWGLYPVDVNVIKIPSLTDGFRQFLKDANDPILTDSYTDHIIAGSRVSYTLNTQTATRQRQVFYYRANLETSGNVLHALHGLDADRTKFLDPGGDEYFTVAGVRYAQYLKLTSDFRYYLNVHEKSTAAFRVALGAGQPLANLDVLPFETSFFSGGANGLRAWRARTLGPGGYNAPLVAFDRIGEAMLEANAEYRFKLISYLEGALFCDVGNIWLLQDDPNKPNSQLSSKILGQLAVGTGVGARLNFDYFIVRFDLALQTKDPALPPGERWIFQPKDQYELLRSTQLATRFEYEPVLNLNLGIGYPF
jgi:outer membrane protein assembly factor BamA